MQDVDAFLLGRRTYVTHAEAGVNRTFALKSATPYPTGVVGLHYVRER